MSLRAHRLAAGYRRRPVFRDASLAVAAGDIVGLIAPNGAGKTTLLRTVAGFIRPFEGTVVCDGPVMYFGGESTLPSGCRVSAWTALIGNASRDRRPFRQLSRGTRQAAGLAAWLSRSDWSVGLLDEPWEGLDPVASRWLTGELRRHAARGAAIVVSSHRLHDVVDVCTAFAFLRRRGVSLIAPDPAASDARVRVEDLLAAFDTEPASRWGG